MILRSEVPTEEGKPASGSMSELKVRPKQQIAKKGKCKMLCLRLLAGFLFLEKWLKFILNQEMKIETSFHLIRMRNV